METTTGTSAAHVESGPRLDEALASAGAWDYFALLHLLECWSGAARIGGTGPVADEPVRLRGHLSLSFPERDIVRARRRAPPDSASRRHQAQVEVEVAFLGLYGVDSPLPLHVTEEMLHAAMDEDRDRVRDFLDLFNHRLLSLLYRAWARYRIDARARDHSLTQHLSNLLEIPTFPEETGLDAEQVMAAAGLFYQRPRSAMGLEQVLRLFLADVPVRVLSCVSREVELPPEERSRLGRRRSRLGTSLVLGAWVWDITGKLRVQVGPVDVDTLPLYQTDGPRFAKIQAVVDLWCEGALLWDLEIRVKSQDLRPAALGGEGEGLQLGINAWLGQPPTPLTAILIDPSGA